MTDPYRGRIDPPVFIDLDYPPQHLGQQQRVTIQVGDRIIQRTFVAKEMLGTKGYRWVTLQSFDSLKDRLGT